jgi:hypothetical protein
MFDEIDVSAAPAKIEQQSTTTNSATFNISPPHTHGATDAGDRSAAWEFAEARVEKCRMPCELSLYVADHVASFFFPVTGIGRLHTSKCEDGGQCAQDGSALIGN